MPASALIQCDYVMLCVARGCTAACLCGTRRNVTSLCAAAVAAAWSVFGNMELALWVGCCRWIRAQECAWLSRAILVVKECIAWFSGPTPRACLLSVWHVLRALTSCCCVIIAVCWHSLPGECPLAALCVADTP